MDGDTMVALPQWLTRRPRWTYNQDGLATIHNADFLADPRFRRAYARASAGHVDLGIPWRIHTLTWAATNAMRLGGDFVECGVNRGFSSTAVLTWLDWNRTRGERRCWLMDTFNGLQAGQLNDEEHAIGRLEQFRDFYPECYEQARANFAEFKGVELIRGAIPDTLGLCRPQGVAFMHIDMNCAAPEVAALRHFWPLLKPGALVVLDDYAFHGYQPQKDAMDALGRELGFAVLSLPTGQGLIQR
jgi:hypothetical protein